MSRQPDVFRDGLATGWKVLGADLAPVPDTLQCDVVIVGSGAGGGISAELLARAGLDVIVLEDGPLKTSRDFNQRESEAYPALYHEATAQKTADKGIGILQGRCVGGSTTVNWTSSFRTPDETLAFWRDRYGLSELTPEAMAPFFEQAERRLHIESWHVAPNENNDLLRRGAIKLGISSGVIRRNVKGCWNLGSCGLGCPTNAKQSMLVTTLPAALQRGARLLVQTRAERFELRDGQVAALHALARGNSADGQAAARPVRISARHYIVAGGGIHSPALLLRSQAPDPHGLLGKRTFLHPVVMTAAVMPELVQGWSGAPQTVYSDHFLHTQAIDGPLGYKLEVPPIHPVIIAASMPGFGPELAEMLRKLPHTHVQLALLRDGFAPQSQGGAVRLRADGSPELDYPLNDFVMEGARRALLSMAELQFAAGALEVIPVHEAGGRHKSWAQAREALQQLPLNALSTRVVSAHVMGGCAMAADAQRGVVRPDGQHWQIANLSVHDGSLFPTSIGANPQLSIYGLVNRLTQGLIARLGGRPEPLA